jgi:PEP-CTERM motif
MKRLLLASLIWVGLAGVVHATASDCYVLMAANSTGNDGTTTCTITPDPGFYISALTLTGADDYTGYINGDPLVNFGATLDQSTTVFSIPTFCTVFTDASGDGEVCNDTVLPANTVTGLDLSSYTLRLTNASNTVTGGDVVGDSIVLNLDYAETESPPPPPPMPEPSSLLLLSSGLVGLGFMKRKLLRT